MPLWQAALRTALVTAMAFPHHRAQEKIEKDREKIATSDLARPPSRTLANPISGNAVAESENIVVETAEKIFADLADARTINRDK